MTSRTRPVVAVVALAVALAAVVGAGLALGTVDTRPSKAELQQQQPNGK
ncbi:hypothetical protein [Allokutzneria oryzae]|uniref:Uncharacterized protein n=1 Tax=Allokutzneria oryzae TaxID=1378989 RepID=A0ABV5ZW63_9PSEU